MAHHGKNPFEDFDDNNPDGEKIAKLKKMLTESATQQYLGGTDHYPAGRLNTDDEGEVRFAVGTTADKKVVVDFGGPVAWVGLMPEQAIELAELLIKRARQCGTSRSLIIGL